MVQNKDEIASESINNPRASRTLGRALDPGREGLRASRSWCALRAHILTPPKKNKKKKTVLALSGCTGVSSGPSQKKFENPCRKASSRGAYGHDPFWRASTWFHNNRYYNGTIYIIDNVIVLSDLVESSGYSSKTLQKGSCPYAPLDEVLRYGMITLN